MRIRTRRRHPYEDAMHAMIDVIFLLLIYFMCTATFSTLEKDVDADMPTGVSSQQKREQRDLEPIRLYVQASGGIRCNGVFCPDRASLDAKLKRLRALAEVPVIVDGDGSVGFGQIVMGMDSAIGAGFSQISFAAVDR